MLAGKRRNPVDHTTWEFLRPGWWVFHALAIGGTLLLGRRLTKR
ncbi:MAG: hypothetical protein QME79_08565 [Bacillota bacterium]|nr:hypothetical protein [Bacillota bacterium]